MGPKKKNKKGCHNTPEVHPHVLKRREADRIKAEKKFARCLKKMKKNRNRTNTTTLSSNNSEASFPENIPVEISDEGSDLQSNSTCSEPIASLGGEEQMVQETGNKNAVKNTEKDCMESQPNVPKLPENVTGEKLSIKNVVETDQGCSKSSLIRPLGGKKLPEDPVLAKVATRDKESVEETSGKESLKSEQPIKTKDCFRKYPNAVSEVRKKLTEKLLKRKNELQMKLESFESEKKHLDEQRNELFLSKKRTPFKDPDLAIIGDIKLSTSKEPGKRNDENQDTYSYYDKNKRVFHLGDEHVQITILIKQGSQIICKSRRRPLVSSTQDNVESDRRTLKSETMIVSDKDVLFDYEDQEKLTTYATIIEGEISEFIGEEYQAVEDQAISMSVENIIPDEKQDVMTTKTKSITNIVEEIARDEYQTQEEFVSKSDGDFLTDEKQQIEIPTEIKCTPIRTIEIPKENSRSSSVQESVKTICENFLKDFISACEQFETRMRNLIREDQNLRK